MSTGDRKVQHAHRETFRPARTDLAWQKQLRDRFAAEGPPPGVPHLDLKRARIREISREAAQQVIHKYEWLGTMAKTRYHYGIFFGPYCAGVTCVGTNAHAAPMAPQFYGLRSHTELLVLARGACVHWAPPGTNSRLVSWTIRLLAQAKRGRLVVAYSDTDAGEIGTIYQACGWTYIGAGVPTMQWIAPNGRIYSSKLAYDCARTGKNVHTSGDYTKALLEAGWTQQKANAKHRYVALLDRSDPVLVAHIEAKRRPYPKRAAVVVPSCAESKAVVALTIPGERGPFNSELGAPLPSPDSAGAD